MSTENNELRPALTPEEWVSWADLRHVTREQGMRTDGGPRLEVHFDPNSVYAFRGDDRLALAALALYGQPFGFTWDDVDAVQEAARVVEDSSPDAPMIDELDALAARIAALLPPRQPPATTD